MARENARRVALPFTYMNGGREKGYPPFLMRKMLSRKLYMTNKTPPQAKTATCCERVSEMRGTLTASEIAQNASRPSKKNQVDISIGSGRGVRRGLCWLTQCSHDLGLKPILALEASGEVADSAPTISSDVGHLSNMVEHVPASEEQNRYQTYRCPDIPVLQNRQDVRRSRGQERTRTENNRDSRYPAHPINRTLDFRVWAVRQMAGEPSVHLFSGWGAVLSQTMQIRFYHQSLVLTQS